MVEETQRQDEGNSEYRRRIGGAVEVDIVAIRLGDDNGGRRQ